MKKPVRVWRTLAALCVVLCAFGVEEVVGQQRYLAVSMVNENDNPHLEVIRGAHDLGMNAVALSIQWGSIHGKISRILKNENGNNYNVWQQYDEQVNLALSLNMKVALNIAVNTGDDKTNSTTDRYGIDTGDGWKKEERMVVVGYNGEEAVFQRQGGPIRPHINLQCVMTSLAAQSTRERITSFTNEVIQRYKHLQNSGNLLYVNLIFTRQGEGEYEIGSTKYHFEQYLPLNDALTDYSQPMTEGYRTWLRGKYGYIGALNSAWGTGYSSFNQVSPKRPSGATFSGPDGRDWFTYRTMVLKEVNNIFKNVVKNIDSGIKVITHHGSVYDHMSRDRGTLPFNEIGAEMDGIKINDAVPYDHRFALDLLRSNMPGKFYVNEAAYEEGYGPMRQLIEESYTHGANMVTIFYFERVLQSDDAKNVMKTIVNDWVRNKQVTHPSASNNDSFTLSNMIDRGGCGTNRNDYGGDCDAYRNWRGAYDNAGGKPVNIFMRDDALQKGCYYKDLTLASNGAGTSAIIPDNKDFNLTGNNCQILGIVKGSGLSQGGNAFSATVRVDNEVKRRNNQPYVQRHYHFTKGGSGETNAKVTIYASADEFNRFNQNSTNKLPANSSDSQNYKANLRVFRVSDSTPANSLGTVINPEDGDIQWDSVLNLWKISFNTDEFSSFYITADNGTSLPVTLVDFTARKQETSAALSWETSEEVNSDHFEIQHSTDGKQWNALGSVAAVSEGKAQNTYTFNHADPFSGQNLYRLKMVDKDGTFALSRIAALQFNLGHAAYLFPNPAPNGVVNLRYAGALPGLSLADLNGRTIPFTTENEEPGKIIIKPSVKLPVGLYILKTSANGAVSTHKVLITQ